MILSIFLCAYWSFVCEMFISEMFIQIFCQFFMLFFIFQIKILIQF